MHEMADVVVYVLIKEFQHLSVVNQFFCQPKFLLGVGGFHQIHDSDFEL